MTRPPLVVRERTELLLDEDARAQWQELENDPQLRLAELRSASAASVEFDAPVTIESAFGLVYEADFERPVTDPDSGQSVSQYSARMLFAGLSSPDERPMGLIFADASPYPAAEATASGRGRKVRSLVVPEGGDWQLAEESVLDESGNLVDADGFWDAFRSCIGGCGTTCLASLGGCLPLGALPAIVACLAATCGYCAAKCAACVACDCGWLCRPIVGCCHQ
ncbi:hypothetical protein AB0L74_21510 [Streptomyces sp. NPDC052020]|uniref:hypothetical protein n=1 Tax=Streptomyces sp. NPDC052020 TaxID=3155677 RepID=UPI003413BAD9